MTYTDQMRIMRPIKFMYYDPIYEEKFDKKYKNKWDQIPLRPLPEVIKNHMK